MKTKININGVNKIPFYKFIAQSFINNFIFSKHFQTILQIVS